MVQFDVYQRPLFFHKNLRKWTTATRHTTGRAGLGRKGAVRGQEVRGQEGSGRVRRGQG